MNTVVLVHYTYRTRMIMTEGECAHRFAMASNHRQRTARRTTNATTRLAATLRLRNTSTLRYGPSLAVAE